MLLITQYRQKEIMPNGYENIQILKNYYQTTVKGTVSHALFPGPLAKTLSNDASNYRDIFLSALKNTNFAQRKVFKGLDIFLHSPHAKAWTLLHEHNLLSGESGQANFDAIANHANPESLARALIYLSKANLLQENNREAISKLENPDIFTTLVNDEDFKKQRPDTKTENLTYSGFLSGELAQVNFENLMANPYNIANIIDGLRALYSNPDFYGSPTKDNCIFVAKHHNPKGMGSIISNFAETDLFTSQSSDLNRTAISQLKDPESFKEATYIYFHQRLFSDSSYNRKTQRAQENFNILIEHLSNLEEVVKALDELYHFDYPNPPSLDIRNYVANHSQPLKIAQAINVLKISSTENSYLRTIEEHDDPCSSAYALKNLIQSGLLSGPNANQNMERFKFANQDIIGVIAFYLKPAELLQGPHAQTNFDALMTHANPKSINKAFFNLKDITGDSSAQKNFDTIMSHANPIAMSEATYRLSMANPNGLVGPEKQANFDAVMGHESPEQVSWIFCNLERAHLLSGDMAQSNREAVLTSTFLTSLSSVISLLINNRLLTQDNFSKLTQHSAVLFGNDEARYRWSWIRQLTQEQFNRMIQICENHQHNPEDGAQAFVNYVDETLGIREPILQRAGRRLNTAQSTHTASVHKTVSESANRLMLRYYQELNVASTIKKVIKYVNSLPNNTLQHRAAKACIVRLTADDYAFTDPGSNVSTRQLLALSWLAIHDKNNRVSACSLDDAKKLFIEGLYEIQRGYNLSEDEPPVDDGAEEDESICLAGTFNKLMDKLYTIIHDVEIIAITKEAALEKLPQVIREEALTYLTKLKQSESPEDRKMCKLLVESIDRDSDISIIFERIKSTVSTRMFEEYGSLFKDNINNPSFIDFINHGKFTDLGDLSSFREQTEMLDSITISTQSKTPPVDNQNIEHTAAEREVTKVEVRNEELNLNIDLTSQDSNMQSVKLDGLLLAGAILLAIGSAAALTAIYLPDHMPNVMSALVDTLVALKEILVPTASVVISLSTLSIFYESRQIHKKTNDLTCQHSLDLVH